MNQCICGETPCKCVPLDRWPNSLRCVYGGGGLDEQQKLNLQCAANRIRDLEESLAECYRLCNADPGWSSNGILAKHAVSEVRSLRDSFLGADDKVEELQAKVERYREILAAWTDWRPDIGIVSPVQMGHGPCCCCTACGQFHDDCVCQHNEIEEQISEIEGE